MKPTTALQTLVVTACYLTALTSGMANQSTEPTKPSPIGDSTHSYTGRNLVVQPYFKTSPQTSSATRQPTHGHNPGVSDPSAFPPPPQLPRQFHPEHRLRRPAFTKQLRPPFHVYSADTGGLVPRRQDTPSAPDQERSQGTDRGKTGIDASGSAVHSRQKTLPLQPTGAEPNSNRTLATNGTATGNEETSPAATGLSASTIWTLVMCAAMIIAAVAFFAVVLAVCRCRQRRERRKKYLTTHKDIRVMKNIVKMAARREKETVRQGPFGRSSIA
ncbi:uncharacterized protein LOC144104470 [Amblyomma americanum]